MIYIADTELADQYPDLVPQLVKTKKGTLAITDRTLTIQYIYNVFYWYIANLMLYIRTSTLIKTGLPTSQV